jgi:hypothetical protein
MESQMMSDKRKRAMGISKTLKQNLERLKSVRQIFYGTAPEMTWFGLDFFKKLDDQVWFQQQAGKLYMVAQILQSIEDELRETDEDFRDNFV